MKNLLAIDVGNSNTVIGYYDLSLKKLIKVWRILTHPIPTSDELVLKINQLLTLNKLNLNNIDFVGVSSVVPQMTSMIRTAFYEYKTFFINSNTEFSFIIEADPKDQVGADRLVNAETVAQEFKSTAIIVDSGTATTLCALKKKKDGSLSYLGGAIIPGIELSIQTLSQKTAKLFTIELTPPTKAIGHNTQTALQSGLLLGYASLIDGMVERFKNELNEKEIPVVATGGVSTLLKDLCKSLTHIDQDLTLKGIAYVAQSICSR